MNTRVLLSQIAVISSVLFPTLANGIPRYTITDLGSLVESSDYASFGYGMNNKGQITGTSDIRFNCGFLGCYPVKHPFMWNPKTAQMTDLGNLGDAIGNYLSIGKGINNRGQITGFAATAGEHGSGNSHAFVWNPRTAQMTDLGTFDGHLGDFWSGGHGINNKGQITGEATVHEEDSQIFSHAFIWNPKTAKMRDMGTLCESRTYGCFSVGHGINRKGQVVGSSSFTDKYNTPGGSHAFFWNPKTAKMRDIGTLCGPQAFECLSNGYGINNRGEITGDSEVEYTSGSEPHAILWSPKSGKMRDLGTLHGGRSVGLGINDYGHIVGSSQYSDSEPHAFLWRRKPGMVDLNSLIPADSGWHLREATAINNRGQIVANGYHPVLGTHALLLKPKN